MSRRSKRERDDADESERPNPYVAPRERTVARNPAEALANPFGDADRLTPLDRTRLALIAQHQRLLIYAMIVYIVAGGFAQQVPALGLLAYLGSLGLALYAIIGLAKTLFSTGTAIFYCLLMFVPLINLLALLILNRRATAHLRRGGIEVGFLGANPRQFAS